MDNNDKVLEALEEFGREPSSDIPPVLGRYLERIAITGETLFPWSSVKPLFVSKMDEAMKKFHQEVPTDHLAPCPNVENLSFEAMRQRLLVIVDSFTGTPFTIQRLCELITEPKKHYKRTDKFLRGIEKNMLVVSSVDTRGNKIVYESKPMVNGMSSNGLESMHGTPVKSFLTPPAPANSPATSSWCNASSDSSWAQGAGDTPTASPLARQPIRAEAGATSTSQPDSEVSGTDSTPKEQAQDNKSSGATEQKKQMATEIGEETTTTAEDKTKCASETKASTVSIDPDTDCDKTAATEDSSDICNTDADSDAGKVTTGAGRSSSEAGRSSNEADRSSNEAGRSSNEAGRSSSEAEQSGNTEGTPSTTTDSTGSDTDDVSRRDSGDSGGFETSDDVSDADMPESSTGTDPLPSAETCSSEATAQQSPPTEHEESCKRPQPGDDCDLPDQSPCKKMKLDSDALPLDHMEAEHKPQEMDAEAKSRCPEEAEETVLQRGTKTASRHQGESAAADCSSSSSTVEGKTDAQIDSNTADSQIDCSSSLSSSSSAESCSSLGGADTCTPDSAANTSICTTAAGVTMCTPGDTSTCTPGDTSTCTPGDTSTCTPGDTSTCTPGDTSTCTTPGEPSTCTTPDDTSTCTPGEPSTCTTPGDTSTCTPGDTGTCTPGDMAADDSNAVSSTQTTPTPSGSQSHSVDEPMDIDS